MTISSSLNAGVSGLASNATRLGTISDNIANASTFGYRRVETDFHSMVIGSGNGSYTAGGVRASTQRLISEGGSLVGTNNPLDIAVRGNGFIPVAKASEVTSGVADPTMFLTSTGSFRPDEQGYLRSESGLMLLGWPAEADGTMATYPRDTSQGLEPVQMTVNDIIATPTSQIDLGINLPTHETLDDPTQTEYRLSVEYYDNMGSARSLTAIFTPADADPTDAVATPIEDSWALEIQDEAGTTLDHFRLNFNNGVAAPPAGGTINSVERWDPAGPAWVAAPMTPQVTLNAGGPNEQTIGIFTGTPGETDGMSQLGDSFAPVGISRDGTEAGTMTSVDIDENGFVTAYFDNGGSRRIYQVPLAAMANPNGMTALDRQVFLPTPESGGFVLWNAGNGPAGEIVGFAREESATDVAAELTDMIQTQRAYSSNAKVIQTVDEMLQETTNIKR